MARAKCSLWLGFAAAAHLQARAAVLQMESKVAALEAEGARQQRAAEAAVAQLRKESDTGEELQRLLVSEGGGLISMGRAGTCDGGRRRTRT